MRKRNQKRRIVSLLLSMFLAFTMFPVSAFAAEEKEESWKIGEAVLKKGDILPADTEWKNDAEGKEIWIFTEKADLDAQKDLKQDPKQENQETYKTEQEGTLKKGESWKLKDLSEKAKKAEKDYQLQKAKEWNGSWEITRIEEKEKGKILEVQLKVYEYVAVTDISGIPSEMDGTAELKAKILPENADQTKVIWNITEAGTTGAVIKENVLTVKNAGTIKIRASVKDGAKVGTDFTKDFTIVVKAADYSKWEEVKKQIPVSEEWYTEETLQDVKMVRDSLQENLPASEQSTVDAATENLRAALQNLQYRPADYSAVDAALAKIPEDLSDYTDETVEALQAAKNAVVTGKNITEQEQVDGYAKAIEQALAQLTRKTFADYTRVEEAIRKIPEDLSIYTEESVQAVQKAQEGIVRGLESGKQSEVDEMAQALENAIAALKMKEADYEIVDEVLEKIPADLSLYTEESVQALEEAKSKVVRGKTIQEQAQVNAYAKDLENALAELKLKKADYRVVDQAIEKIPADLTLYTEDSVKVLEDAKNSVVRERPITEQEAVNAYAQKIEEAMQSLKYRDADYTKVDEALHKIPSDLKKYTEESVKAVQDAKAAVVRGKNITEQKTVDGYAEAVEKAVKGLKTKAIAAESLPKMSKGSKQTGIQGKELSFTADTAVDSFKKVLVDNKEIDSKKYYVSGKETTQITLKAEYTKTLAEGKHTIRIVTTKGQADAVFYLKKATRSPETGDGTQILQWMMLFVLSAAALAGVGVVMYRKKKK